MLTGVAGDHAVVGITRESPCLKRAPPPPPGIRHSGLLNAAQKAENCGPLVDDQPFERIAQRAMFYERFFDEGKQA
jgi:hypothetical protein